MTIKEAKDIVKKAYPKAVCCSEYLEDKHSGRFCWHRMVRSRRGGEALGPALSCADIGADGQAWKQAAESLTM